MNIRAVGLATALAMTLGNRAVIQTAASLALITAAAWSPSARAAEIPVQSSERLRFDSLPDLGGDEQLAMLLAGPYLQVGSHQVRVPSRAVSMLNGKILLEPETLHALNFLPRD